MIYIDFDGVILDTGDVLFEEWRKNPNRFFLPESEKIKYIQKKDWNVVLNNSNIINDSIYYLSQMDPKETAILTKVHSLSNEAGSKIKWCREKKIKQNVIVVPYNCRKNEVVGADGNILIDDCLKNLDDWSIDNGKGIFFDMNDDNYDSWNQPNTKNYQKVLNLSSFSQLKK